MSTLTLPSGATVEIDNSADLRMREFRAWADAENRGDFAATYPYLLRFVKAWAFAEPPSIESLDDLSLSDFLALTRGVSEAIKQSNAAKN